MNPALLIGLAAVAFLALRGGGDDEVDEGVDGGENSGNNGADGGADDLGEEPNSGEISGQNGTWRWTAFAELDRIAGQTTGQDGATGWNWTVGKVDDSSLDVDGTASNRLQARAAGILKATQMANKAPTGTAARSLFLA